MNFRIIYFEVGNWIFWIGEIDICYLYFFGYVCWIIMRFEDFVDDVLGEVEMVDGIFMFSLDLFLLDFDVIYELVSENGEVMYVVG